MTRRVNRRIFLRGLGGACVAAPFLGSLAARGVKAQAAASPKRLIIMFTHYGCITTRFFPTNSHGPLSAADLQPTTLRSLVPYVDKLLMPRGIRTMNEWTTNLARGQGNDTYLQAVASYFTCCPVTPNSDDPYSFDQSTKFQAKPTGPSLDHVIAAQLSSDGAPLFMRVGDYNDSPASGISYSGPTVSYAGLGSPAQIFSTLTGLFQGGGMSQDTYQLVRGKSVLDLVRDDLETLERIDMSQVDKDKLEAWKNLLHETTGVIVPAQCNENAASALSLTQPNVDAASNFGLGADPLVEKVTDSLDGADLYSNLAALAAVCNANPVIVLKYPGSYIFKGLGITIDSASLSHRGDNANLTGPCVTGAVDLLYSIDDYYTKKFAHLVDVLNSFDEGDGTVLDNSATVWFQEVSDGCARNLNNLPIVQAGSMGGYFKTGAAVNVWDGSPNLSRGNSEVQCMSNNSNQYNALTQETGTDPSVANAPINKYFCSLMNAMGVKAGEDGFPGKGGALEVAKYGMYDRTEDFVHGGTAPPTIHDPGEFTALKAGA